MTDLTFGFHTAMEIATEAIDRLLGFAESRRLPVETVGLDGLAKGWRELLQEAGPSRLYAPDGGAERLLILVGDLEATNNVAFTQCLAAARRPGVTLWQVGRVAPLYQRFFARIFPKAADLAKALAEAPRKARVEVLANPQGLLAAEGKAAEKAVLRALRALRPSQPDKGTRRRAPVGPDVTLFWNARNAGYLLRKLPVRRGRGSDSEEPDLVLAFDLQPGLEEPKAPPGAASLVRWGLRPAGEDLFIPLPRSLLLSGYSEPSGRAPLRAGELAKDALGVLILR